ncbi:gamma-glutamyltransferase family protein [Ottowia thiooxydans]|uniref:Gamma-glutamyltranspeptidase n=1 Tax=Ottowia thiooxydans TaxID=219182 RepID=A0ABV2QCN4_9BURK
MQDFLQLSKAEAGQGVTEAAGAGYAVVSSHPLATSQAQRVLQAGGNAFDAAVAGAAMLCVALPHACGLGGDCFAMVHDSSKNEVWSLNGSGASPQALPPDLSSSQLGLGPLSCGVPGMVGGWHAIHQRFGHSTWASLIEPAARLAAEGIEVCDDLAQAFRLFDARVRRDTGLGKLFLVDEQLPVVGERLLQSPLSRSLQAIADNGPQALYQGTIGQSICQVLQAQGGSMSLDDLSTYEPIWSHPLRSKYRGLTVNVAPPNSFGLFMLLQLLALEDTDVQEQGLLSSGRLALLMRAARTSFAHGLSYVGDPSHVVSPQEALSPVAAQALREGMRSISPARSVSKSQGTATISVVDKAGHAITLIQSIFKPFGAMVADAATGVILNNRLAGFHPQSGHPNSAGPGKRPAHTLNPVMVTNGGRLKYLLGTPGGSGQTITLTHVLSALVDLKLSLRDSIAAPRWSMDLAGGLLIEPGLAEGVAAGVPAQLREQGLDVQVAVGERFFFGSAECIELADDGRRIAVADDRRDASCAAGN